MLKEFKEFALKGNVVDLAIGVIIGGAFGAVVNSVVADILSPIIGLLTGGVDFAQMKAVIQAADEVAGKPEVAIMYGNLINAVISFFIIAFVLFLIVKGMNAAKREEAAAPPPPAEPPAQEKLLAEIRDLLKARG
jgi:large conductance mechanosensitive channel